MERVDILLSQHIDRKIVTLYEIIDDILHVIQNARKNKAYASKYYQIIKQVMKAISGIEYTFLKQAEFYADLKETLSKIQYHLVQSTNRGKLVRKVMARKDISCFSEIQTHVDMLCGRIFLAYAERMKQKQTYSDIQN